MITDFRGHSEIKLVKPTLMTRCRTRKTRFGSPWRTCGNLIGQLATASTIA